MRRRAWAHVELPENLLQVIFTLGSSLLALLGGTLLLPLAIVYAVALIVAILIFFRASRHLRDEEHKSDRF